VGHPPPESPEETLPRRSALGTFYAVFEAKNDQIREALVCLYGIVAAVIRNDRVGAELLLDDLEIAFASRYELLTTISFATLERLDATIDDCHFLSEDDGKVMASDLLSMAQHYGIASLGAVQSAAWRLDAVRRRDHDRVVAEVDDAARVADTHDLVAGATALLTAAVCVWARTTGRSPRRASSDLCLAAALDAVS
jgi:hypothetical protein